MAYLLRFGQSGRSVDFATPITAPTSSFSLEYTVAITNTAAWQSVFFNNESLSTNTAGSFGSQRDNANNRVNVWFTLDGKARVIYVSPTNFTFGAPFTIRIEWSAATSQIRIFQDGTLLTTYNGYSTFNIAPINGISRNIFQGDLYAFKIIMDGVTYDWNPSASGGTGIILPDIGVSANNGTLVNFTVPDCWVFYSSGATYQLTALGGTFTYSGQTAALNRGFKLAAQGGIYSYTGASASLLRQFKLTAQGGAYSYAGASASLLRGFKLAANGGAYSYAGASASLTYVSGPTVYRLTALGVTYVYSGGAAALTTTGIIPAANPSAFVNRARVAGAQTVPAKVGSLLVNNARIDGMLINKGRLAQ